MCTLFRSSGRPRITVAIEDIEFLRGLRFSWTRIAEILQISRSTLYRRLEEEGLSRESTFSDISDLELDRVVASIKRSHPNDGERLMFRHLAMQNIIVQRARLRASIHRVDPINTALRRSVAIRRRVYHCEGPNAVWHLDGNHKLIKWRFVIHGCIDAYSRTVVFLHCSDNNRASTVLASFTRACEDYGLPTKICTDLGGENIETWRYMIEQQETPSAVITGSSTHNERVERLWRDVYRCVGVLFADTFRQLECEGNLDSLNEIDLFCLHYVFKPRINSTLKAFRESWNNHSLSSCNNQTPNQLFISGAVRTGTFPQQPNAHVPNGLPRSANPPIANDLVTVPRISFEPCSALFSRLSMIDPLGQSVDFGCDIFVRVVNIVGQHLRAHCSDCV